MDSSKILRRSSRLSNNCELRVNGRDYLSRRLGCSIDRLEEWMQSATVQYYLQQWYTAAVINDIYHEEVLALIHNGRFYPSPAKSQGSSHQHSADDFEAEVLLACINADKCQVIDPEQSRSKATENWGAAEIWAHTAWCLVHNNRAAGQCFQHWPELTDCHAFVIDLLCIAFHSIVHRGVDSRYHILIDVAHTPRLIEIDQLNAKLPAHNGRIPQTGNPDESYLLSSTDDEILDHEDQDEEYEADDEDANDEDAHDKTYTGSLRTSPKKRHGITYKKSKHIDSSEVEAIKRPTKTSDQSSEDSDSDLTEFTSEEETPETRTIPTHKSPEKKPLRKPTTKTPASNDTIASSTRLPSDTEYQTTPSTHPFLSSPSPETPPTLKRKVSRQLSREDNPNDASSNSSDANQHETKEEKEAESPASATSHISTHIPPTPSTPRRRSSRIMRTKQKATDVTIAALKTPLKQQLQERQQLRTPESLPRFGSNS